MKIGIGLALLGLWFGTDFAQGASVYGIVERVVDGDTVWVRTEGTERLKIRMLGMDTPESVFPSEQFGVVGQRPWGKQATAYLQSLVQKMDKVRVDTWGVDQYGRTLGYVVKANLDLNMAMARSGWGLPYALCSGADCNARYFANHRVAQFSAVCQTAKNEGKGVFAFANPLHEMPFEFRLRMGGRVPEKFVGHVVSKKLYHPREYNKVDVCRRIFFTSEADAMRLGYRY